MKLMVEQLMRKRKVWLSRLKIAKMKKKSGCQEEESDEKMALFVKRFNRMMSKKNFGKRGQSSRKKSFCGQDLLPMW